MVVGATFLLGILRASCASQAPLVWVCRSFYGREPPAGAASRVARGGFTAFQLLISEGYGGEGKTASSNLRNLSWGAPNPPPVPLCARTRRQVHSNLIKATTHRINDSARSKSSLSGAFQESLQRSVRNEQPTCGNFVATQTAVQSSNVGDTVAGDAGPGSYFFDSCGVGRSVQFRIGEARYPICRSHRHLSPTRFWGASGMTIWTSVLVANFTS